MTARAYLQQIRKLSLQIENKLEEARRWREIACGVTASTDGVKVQSSGSMEKMADAVSAFVDLDAEIAVQICDLERRREAIIGKLEALETGEYQVIYKIYVQNKTLDEAADECGKSYSWAAKKHKQGLSNLERNKENDTKNLFTGGGTD